MRYVPVLACVLAVAGCGAGACSSPSAESEVSLDPAYDVIVGEIRDEDGAPIDGAVVSVAVSDGVKTTLSSRTGRFRLAITEGDYDALPNLFFVNVDHDAFAPSAFELQKTPSSDLGDRTVRPLGETFSVQKVRLQRATMPGRRTIAVERGVVHLGDGRYESAANSRFQSKNASGVDATFTVDIGDYDPTTLRSAKLRMRARGIEAPDEVQINGATKYVTSTTPEDGSSATVDVDLALSELHAGKNEVTLRAVATDASEDDKDDFELATAAIVLETFERTICTDVDVANVLSPMPAVYTFRDPDASRQTYLAPIHSAEGLGLFYDPVRGIQNDVVLAVIDAGVDLSHADLRRSRWINARSGDWTAPSGLVVRGDANGYNFHDRLPDGAPMPQIISELQILQTHGTSVAGIAAASVDDGIGMAGIAGLKARIMAVNAVGRVVAPPILGVSELVDAIHYAADNGAKVANISVVVTKDQDVQAIKRALEYGLSKGVTFTIAAGNDGREIEDGEMMALGAMPGVITVGGTEIDTGALWNGSNRGRRFVEIVAPATEKADTKGLYAPVSGGGYTGAQGTSFSAPMVAAAAVLAVGLAETRKKSLTPTQVECMILETARVEPGLVAEVNGGKHLDLGRLARQLDAQLR